MKNIEWKEFVEYAYYGADAFMRYHGRIYQFGGFYETHYCIYIYSWIDDGNYSDHHEIVRLTSDSNEDIWQQFLNAKIFEGKTIEEAGDDVEFIDWG